MSDGLQQLQKMPLRQVQNVRQLLVNEEALQRLHDIATSELGANKLVKLTIEALRRNPKIADCNPMSVFNALIQCATLGLEPNTIMGHAYLIPFKDECTFVMGYKGMADLARRHPSVVSIHADVVYDDDELWTYEYGTDRHLRHKPGPRAGKITHAYCFVTLKDGDAFGVLTTAEILKIRDQSQGWQSAVKFGKTAKSPWETHPDKMYRKTALRALANGGEMPMSNEFHLALSADDRSVPSTLMQPNDDPFAGLTIDGTLADDEGDGGAGADPKPKPEPEAGAKPKPKAAAKPKATPKAAAKPKPAPKEQAKPQEAEPSPPDPDVLIANRRIYDEILSDAMDASDIDALIEREKDRIEALEQSDPEMHGQLMAELQEFRAAEESPDGQGSMEV